MTSRMLCGYCVVGLLIGHEEGRKLTLLLPRRNKDNQQHIIILLCDWHGMFSCANCCGWVMPSATRNLDTKESDQKGKRKISMCVCVCERERESSSSPDNI